MIIKMKNIYPCGRVNVFNTFQCNLFAQAECFSYTSGRFALVVHSIKKTVLCSRNNNNSFHDYLDLLATPLRRSLVGNN